jgi:hypothetical protein
VTIPLSEGSGIQCFNVGSVLMDTNLDNILELTNTTQGVVQPTTSLRPNLARPISNTPHNQNPLVTHI